MEIERKFLLNNIPRHLKLKSTAFIEQSYITSGYTEVRIRKRIDSKITYKMCLKSSGNLTREEYELDLTQEQYNNLLSFCKGTPITKEYYVFDLYGYNLECSIVDKDTNNEFIYGEIEFKTEEEANLFIAPNYIKEVTNDKSYKMKNYWNRTREVNSSE